MNQSLTLLPTPDSSSPVNREPKFPESSARSRAAAPFSSMLERAEDRAPDRNTAAKFNKPAHTRAKSASDDNLSPEAERRPRVRDKQKSKTPDADQNLAGAGAVTGTTPPVEITAPATGAGGETETTLATAQENSVIAGGANNKTPRPSALPLPATAEDLAELVSPDAATTPTGGPVTATATVAKTSSPTTALTPATATTELTSPAANPTSENLTPSPSPLPGTMAKLVESAAAPEVSIAAGQEIPVATATSARQAEVLMTLVSEEQKTEVAAPAPEISPDLVATMATPVEAQPIARAARRAQLEQLEKAGGIGSAKSSVTMKNAMKMEEIAGVTEQLLPNAAVNAAAAMTNLPGDERRVVAGGNATLESLHAAGKFSPAPVRSDIGAASETNEVKSVSPLPRVSELISREVRMFKRAGDDLVEVVLTPDTKTQISLRLQWREGQVEVQARCDFGDYSSLNTQWAQLQTTMANHGVRLSHLSERTTTGFTEFFNNPHFARQQEPERQPDAPLGRPESRPTVSVPPVRPGVSAVPRRSNRLFDSWA